MTDEGQEHGPDETPAPPASTRWLEDAVEGSEAIAPPFVPGRAAAPAPTPTPPAGLGQEPVSAPEQEIEPELESGAYSDTESATPESPAEDDFPFDQFDIEGEDREAATGEAYSEEVGAPYAEEPDAVRTGWSPADLGLAEEQEERPERGAVEREPEPEAADSAPEWEPEAAAPGAMEPEPAAPEPEPEWKPEAPERDLVRSDAAEDAAELLDRLAGMLRTEGEAAVRREMDSPDRLTAVLAGLLAGYVSGRS